MNQGLSKKTVNLDESGCDLTDVTLLQIKRDVARGYALACKKYGWDEDDKLGFRDLISADCREGLRRRKEREDNERNTDTDVSADGASNP